MLVFTYEMNKARICEKELWDVLNIQLIQKCVSVFVQQFLPLDWLQLLIITFRCCT